MQFLRMQSPLILAIWGALAATMLVTLGVGRWSLAFVSFATLGLSIAPTVLASRLAITVPIPFLVATTLFIIGSIFMGEAFDFYERFWWWDLALHTSSAIGFGLIGFLFIFMLFEGDRFAAPPIAITFLSFCLAMTVGAIWEVFEYGMDQTFGLNMQKSGLEDTMGDLIVDAVGGAVGAFSGFLYLKGRQSQLFAPLLHQFIEANRRYYQKAKERMRR